MMYARLRGVPEEAVVAIVERTLNELSLLANGNADNHASKLRLLNNIMIIMISVVDCKMFKVPSFSKFPSPSN